jgi:uncharacterized protein YidB (DUF937 family)
MFGIDTARMAHTKKLIGAAAFSLALAGGGIAGSLLGAPGTSGAQESTTTTEEAPDERPHRRGRHLATAAEALGMTEEELRAELEDGKTIADVAGERGVDIDTVIDALVTVATADIRERMTAVVNGEAPEGGRRAHHGPGGRRGGFHVSLDLAAEAIGVTDDELHGALEDGQSLAQVAEANGVDVQTVIDALVAEINAHIDEKVADGDLSEEEGAERKAEAAERITDLVNREGVGFRGERGRRP